MTPLAHRVVRQLMDPQSRSAFAADDCAGLASRMDDIHCFEVSEVLPLACDLARRIGDGGGATEMMFLPSPRTWIEFRDDGNNLVAYHLSAAPGYMEVALVFTYEGRVHTQPLYPILIGANLEKWLDRHADQKTALLTLVQIASFLTIINSPRCIGRVQHMPHRGLERQLLKARAMVGKFPLRAWTEIKLSVSDIGKRADGTEYEAHYTGEKCLHFCRAHLRIRNGRLERVSSHWRGNPALGIKRSRYAVTT